MTIEFSHQEYNGGKPTIIGGTKAETIEFTLEVEDIGKAYNLPATDITVQVGTGAHEYYKIFGGISGQGGNAQCEINLFEKHDPFFRTGRILDGMDIQPNQTLTIGRINFTGS